MPGQKRNALLLPRENCPVLESLSRSLRAPFFLTGLWESSVHTGLTAIGYQAAAFPGTGGFRSVCSISLKGLDSAAFTNYMKYLHKIMKTVWYSFCYINT